MKRLICRSFAVALVAAGLSLPARADSPDGQVDFGKFTAPGKGGQFVEIEVKSNLISIAAQLVEGKQPGAAKLLHGVQLVHVNVIGLTKENGDDLRERVQGIHRDLEAQGWDHNVTVQGKGGEDVGVYTKTRDGESLAGLAITVVDPKNVVLVNVVGDIRPEQVAALGETLNIKPLKDIGASLKK